MVTITIAIKLPCRAIFRRNKCVSRGIGCSKIIKNVFFRFCFCLIFSATVKILVRILIINLFDCARSNQWQPPIFNIQSCGTQSMSNLFIYLFFISDFEKFVFPEALCSPPLAFFFPQMKFYYVATVIWILQFIRNWKHLLPRMV